MLRGFGALLGLIWGGGMLFFSFLFFNFIFSFYCGDALLGMSVLC
jgi:hypothetical protein